MTCLKDNKRSHRQWISDGKWRKRSDLEENEEGKTQKPSDMTEKDGGGKVNATISLSRLKKNGIFFHFLA